MADLTIREVDGGVVFTAKILPCSSKTTICGLLDGMLKIKVSAAAAKGKANQCLVNFLAKKIGVKKKCASIISGRRNPVKEVQVLGVSAETFLKNINLNEQGLNND